MSEGGLIRRPDLGLVRFWQALALLGALLLIPAAAAASTLVSQGYQTSGNLPDGSIVSLENNSSTNVDSSTLANANNILGVVIASDNSQLSLSNTQGNQVQVATSGVEPVLVSDINGNISSGDPITASPISGVGMKATNSAKIIGIAQDSFPNSTSSKQSYSNKTGQHSVNLGDTSVLINVSYFTKQPDKTIIPAALQNIANDVAGKTVNSIPILVSMAIFIITLVVVVSIVYSMIRSSIISVGRNPMSQAAVYRDVIQLSSLVIIILGVALVSIYIILTKL